MTARARAPERKFAEALARVDADGRFCGYASLFGRVDLSGDVVMPGAFARTLRLRGPQGIGMFLEHDPAGPIGTWQVMEEDRRGLWVEGRLGGGADAARVGAAMRAGMLDGLSIGFRTVAADEDRRARVRRLIEIDLWEVSVVVAPMLPEARARAAGDGRVEAGDEAIVADLADRMRQAAAILRHAR
jgi:hypothetical protein